MKQLALSIEQMKHLESLGLDTSDASMFYTSLIKKGEYILLINTSGEAMNKPLLLPGSIIPAYTLQDILEKLPNKIQTDEGEMSLVIDNYQHHIWIDYRKMVSYGYELQYEGIYHGEHHFNYIEAFYNMLLWCIENNHIKTSNK